MRAHFKDTIISTFSKQISGNTVNVQETDKQHRVSL